MPKAKWRKEGKLKPGNTRLVKGFRYTTAQELSVRKAVQSLTKDRNIGNETINSRMIFEAIPPKQRPKVRKFFYGSRLDLFISRIAVQEGLSIETMKSAARPRKEHIPLSKRVRDRNSLEGQLLAHRIRPGSVRAIVFEVKLQNPTATVEDIIAEMARRGKKVSMKEVRAALETT